MGTMITKWRPSWWTDAVHGSAWDRVKDFRPPRFSDNGRSESREIPAFLRSNNLD